MGKSRRRRDRRFLRARATSRRWLSRDLIFWFARDVLRPRHRQSDAHTRSRGSVGAVTHACLAAHLYARFAARAFKLPGARFRRRSNREISRSDSLAAPALPAAPPTAFTRRSEASLVATASRAITALRAVPLQPLARFPHVAIA